MIEIKNISLLINGVVVIASLLSIVYTLGVVWRVEKKLDISYKLFLIAILSFFASVAIPFFNALENAMMMLASDLFKMLFALLFLAGVYTMRNMIRKIDGEK